MQNYDMLIERIVRESKLEREEVERRVEAKKAKLSGLISKEGAAQIIAAELNISFDNIEAKIGELMPGMRNVSVVGKILNLFPVREFERNGRKGKVLNFVLADDTNNMRIVLWDTNHIALFEEGKIRAGDVIEIRNGGMREGELHLSSFSEIKKSNKIIDNIKTERVMQEKNIAELVEGAGVMVRGNVVQLFNPRFFYVCPECGKKANQESEGFSCQEHGKIQAKERAILNFVLDDGTETIRVVLFSEGIEKLILEGDLKDAEKLSIFREDLLGSELWISGNVRKNQLFGNLEIIGQNVEKVEVEQLIQILEKN